MDSNAFLLSFGMRPGGLERTEGPIESGVRPRGLGGE